MGSAGGSRFGPARASSRGRVVLAVAAAIGVALSTSCGSDGSGTATTAGTTTTTTTVAAGQVSGGGGSGGGGGGGGAPATTPPPTTPPTPPPTTPPVTETEPTTTVLADLYGPYAVKQIETLGGETISGAVCDARSPFVVSAATDKVTFQFLFTPNATGSAGAVAYAYNIPSAGESHSATGTYTLSTADTTGVRHVSLAVSDHVVFHGFDGPIPLRYKFDLVPLGTTCP